MNILLTTTESFPTQTLALSLTDADNSVELVSDGLRAFELAKRGTFDLIVLHDCLPTLDAPAICKALREAEVTTSILVLATQSDTAFLESILHCGADTLVPTSAEFSLIGAHIQALLRRVQSVRSPLRVGDLTLDTLTRRAEREGKRIALSSTEYLLLEFLMRQAGQVVSRTAIMSHVWPFEVRESDNVLDVYISYVRNKIDRGFSTSLLHTVRGQGYIIEERK